MHECPASYHFTCPEYVRSPLGWSEQRERNPKEGHDFRHVLLLEVTPRFELGNEGFADPCLTTWLCHRMEKGANALPFFHLERRRGSNSATHLGKVALYQMSYARKWCLRSESNQRHADFQSAALPTELQRHIKPLLQPDNGDHEGTRTLDLRRDRPAF